MGRNVVWQDDYWLLLMQIYLQKPVGVKPLYHRKMVDLSIELHIPPQALQARMQQIARLETPRIERIWNTYSQNPRRLSRAVRLWHEMKGFGSAGDFFQGVEVEETFEKDFRPLADDERFTPVMLIIILDLYFKLSTITMVAETPEVQETARLLKLKPADVVMVLTLFQTCDPYLKRSTLLPLPLVDACKHIWQRFAQGPEEQLSAFADELKVYFTT